MEKVQSRENEVSQKIQIFLNQTYEIICQAEYSPSSELQLFLNSSESNTFFAQIQTQAEFNFLFSEFSEVLHTALFSKVFFRFNPYCLSREEHKSKWFLTERITKIFLSQNRFRNSQSIKVNEEKIIFIAVEALKKPLNAQDIVFDFSSVFNSPPFQNLFSRIRNVEDLEMVIKEIEKTFEASAKFNSASQKSPFFMAKYAENMHKLYHTFLHNIFQDSENVLITQTEISKSVDVLAEKIKDLLPKN